MAGIEDYSTTPGSNTSVNGISIAEGMPPSGVNDAMRQIMADIRREHTVTSLTSSVTVSIGEASGGKIHVITDAGKSISAFDSISAGIERDLIFDVGGILVHDDTKMILPGGANLTMSAGDSVRFLSEGSGNWRLLSYIKRSSRFSIASDAETLTNKTIDGASNTITNIAQGALKTTTGEVGLAQGSTSAHLTLPGGQYGFYPRFYRGNDALTLTDARFANAFAVGTSATATIYMESSSSFDGNDFINAIQRYVQASPPYDLGDGDVPLFAFLLVDSLGRICLTYMAEDPPWANNGPTDITPSFYRHGKAFKLVRPRPNREALLDARQRDAELQRLEGAPRLVEVTQAMKQADMPLIPHPFAGNDLSGKTVVLLDPVSPMMECLQGLLRAGENVHSILHGHLSLDNEPLSRKTPNGVIACRASWK